MKVTVMQLIGNTIFSVCELDPKERFDKPAMVKEAAVKATEWKRDRALVSKNPNGFKMKVRIMRLEDGVPQFIRGIKTILGRKREIEKELKDRRVGDEAAVKAVCVLVNKNLFPECPGCGKRHPRGDHDENSAVRTVEQTVATYMNLHPKNPIEYTQLDSFSLN